MVVAKEVRAEAKVEGKHTVLHEAFVLEDTFVCDVDVTFETIHRETRHRGAGVFGYAGYQQNRDGNTAWCGSKGFYLTHAWWEDMTIVLENSPLADFSHWDMWLVQRQRIGAQPEFKCYAPLGGCGHRASGTQHAGELFGGAWLPGCDDPGQNRQRTHTCYRLLRGLSGTGCKNA